MGVKGEMKEIIRRILGVILLFFGMYFVVSCNSPHPKGLSHEQMQELQAAMVGAGKNSKELWRALENAPKEQQEAIAFLIVHMPARDLANLNAAFLLENVAYAYIAKERFAWGADIPKEIFFNDVLPYCVLNERRDNWRKDFYERFAKYLDGVTELRAAVDSVNKHIRDELMVDYNTQREKPDQSPYESMRQKMASCSGLSILLTDAFRSVCIPSRIAGTPNWYDNRGNHNWNEVWIDGQWYFTEYYPSGLNKSWFMSSAGRADEKDSLHAIYATSYKSTGMSFPLVWDSTITYVGAENVTRRYVDMYMAEQHKKLRGEYVLVKVLYEDPTLDGDRRVAVNVDVFDAGGQVDGGRTLAGSHDLNDMLTFTLKKHHEYLLKYFLPDGTEHQYRLLTGGEEQIVKL